MMLGDHDFLHVLLGQQHMKEVNHCLYRIFGSRTQTVNIENVSKVLADFCGANPGGQKIGATRGAIRLTQYMHMQGSTLRKKQQVCRRLWDCFRQKHCHLILDATALRKKKLLVT